ncbi:MAG: helix-turn-helix transcriptional regulator [Hyphomicrobiales bacterium]|nr:helix-turn-helix transcriptional regulator [Hyphomicrobiales bacterium]
MAKKLKTVVKTSWRNPQRTTVAPPEDHFAHAAMLLVMANPQRLLILERLLGREYHVNELAADVGLSQSATSQHLKKLRVADFVQSRRDGLSIFYRSESPFASAILDLLRNVSLQGSQGPSTC